MEDHSPERYCHECKQEFEDSFALVDHLLPDDEEFDPYYPMPNGVKLYLGSFLRYIFNYSGDEKRIEKIVQSTYITLFAAEMQYDGIDVLVEDMVVSQEMHNFDEELSKLLRGPDDDEGGA